MYGGHHLLLGKWKLRPLLHTITHLMGWPESNMTMPSAGKDTERLRHSCTAAGSIVNMYSHFGKVGQFLMKFHTNLAYDSLVLIPEKQNWVHKCS